MLNFWRRIRSWKNLFDDFLILQIGTHPKKMLRIKRIGRKIGMMRTMMILQNNWEKNWRGTKECKTSKHYENWMIASGSRNWKEGWGNKHHVCWGCSWWKNEKEFGWMDEIFTSKRYEMVCNHREKILLFQDINSF